MNVLESIKKFFNSINSDTIITKEKFEEVLIMAKNLNVGNKDSLELLIDTYNIGGESVERLESEFKDSELKDVMYSMGLEEKKLINNIGKIFKLTNDVVNLIEFLSNSVDDMEDFVKDGMSSKQVLLMTTVQDCMNVNFMIKDLLTYTIYYLNEDELYYKSKEGDLVNNLRNNRELFRFYLNNSSSTIINGVKKVGDEVGRVNEYELSKSGIGFTTKFSSNPVYIIGLWWEDIQKERYDANLHQVNLTNLKIMELRSKLNDGDSSNIKQQIEYHEDKLVILEKKINDYRNMN